MEYAYGHLLDIGPSGQAAQFRFQNYAINQNIDGYLFLPFSFGGAVATLQGDNLDAPTRSIPPRTASGVPPPAHPSPPSKAPSLEPGHPPRALRTQDSRLSASEGLIHLIPTTRPALLGCEIRD